MLSAECLLKAKQRFAIIGPQISEAEVLELFPTPFEGREDLLQFFVSMNGGSRTPRGCLIHCGNPAHRVSRDRLGEIRIEGFFSISADPEEKLLPFAPMLGQYLATQSTFGEVPELRDFLAQHRPIAFDHSGNDIWIDLESGRLRFVDWDQYEYGPTEIAATFQEFVARFWVNAVLPDLD